jgi:hypothetical protein
MDSMTKAIEERLSNRMDLMTKASEERLSNQVIFAMNAVLNKEEPNYKNDVADATSYV